MGLHVGVAPFSLFYYMTIEEHPLKPFLPSHGKILFLGSFPPPKSRWSMDFFYPNFINDMWRIMGIVFYQDKSHFVDENRKKFLIDRIIPFLQDQGIGLFDTAVAVKRMKNTASDKDLEVVETTDLDSLLHHIPQCETVVTTGQKATDIFCGHFQIMQPKVGDFTPFTFNDRNMRLYRMPSSSRAYPMRVERKAEYYARMFQDIT